jgi:hypothetical protein
VPAAGSAKSAAAATQVMALAAKTAIRLALILNYVPSTVLVIILDIDSEGHTDDFRLGLVKLQA